MVPPRVAGAGSGKASRAAVGFIRSESVLETAQPPAEENTTGRVAAWKGALLRLAGESDTRTAVGLWLLTRVGIGILVWITVWTDASAKSRVPESVREVWEHWDWVRYLNIAENGYSLRKIHGASIAFFPGFPALLVVVHFLVRDWILTGLLISFVSGGIACVALARLIRYEAEAREAREVAAGAAGIASTAQQEADGPEEPSTSPVSQATALQTAVLQTAEQRRRAAVSNGLTLFLFSPAAVFLAVGYTEAIFLAFALPAWLAARRGRWVLAGVLTAAASAIRIDGVFLFVALAVMFLLTRPRGGRSWLHGSGLLISLVPPLGFFAYLYHLTGSWLAWSHAEAQGWDRTQNDPLRTFRETWRYAFGRQILPAAEAWEYQVEFLAMATGAAIVIWLLVRRRWPEAVYVGIPLLSLATSHVYLSVARELLLWWPLWAVVGVWAVRRPWVKTIVMTVQTPMMFIIAYLFFTGRWAG